MTLEEKREFVNDYCYGRNCLDCKLQNQWIRNNDTDFTTHEPDGPNCIQIRTATETELDWAIDLIGLKEEPTENPVLKVEDLKKGVIKVISGEKEAVNHPDHYQGPHECIEVMEAMFGKEAVKNFCRCNAFKYRFRAEFKNGAEDIAKAEWYEEYLIKMGGIDNGM